ncbi:MAG: hypothetical protein AAF846_29900 [Chloroflexota bacterium]
MFTHRFLGTLDAYWQTSTTSQRILFITGTILMVWMLAHGMAMFVLDSPLDGPVSLRKAMTFAETGWLMCWATGFVLPYLQTRRWQRWVIIMGVLQFAIVETFLVSLQAWRGVPSHYNFATPFDSVVFSVMGIGALLYLVGMIVLLVTLFGTNTLPPSLRLAFRSGTVLMIIGGLSGYFMMMNLGSLYQGDTAQTLATITSGEIIGAYQGTAEGATGGNILIIHALGVHGLSLAPLAAWLLTYTSLTDRRQQHITALVVWGLFGLITVLTIQMLQLRPLVMPGLMLGGFIAVSLAVLGLGYVLTAWYTLRAWQAPTT